MVDLHRMSFIDIVTTFVTPTTQGQNNTVQYYKMTAKMLNVSQIFYKKFVDLLQGRARGLYGGSTSSEYPYPLPIPYIINARQN